MRIPPAPEGAGRYDHAEEAEGKIDIEPFMEAALEDVVETIMNFGVYPQPRKGKFVRCLFDLYDYIDEIIDFSDMREFLLLSIQDRSEYGEFERIRSRYETTINTWLIAKLRDSEIVADRAEDLANEAREK